MAKKSARRVKPKTTKSQLRNKKRLQHYNNQSKLARRVHIDGWDNELTLRQNYRNLGILYDANDITTKANSKNKDDAPFVGLMTAKLEQMQNMPAKAPYVAKSMSVQEQYRLQDLVRKHGDDYDKMQRDIKINVNQETAKQLQKRIEFMMSLQNLGNEDDVDMDDMDDMDEDDEDMEDFGEDMDAEAFNELFAPLLAGMGDMEDMEDMEDMMEDEDMESLVEDEEEVFEQINEADLPKSVKQQRDMGIVFKPTPAIEKKKVPIAKNSKVVNEYIVAAPKLNKLEYSKPKVLSRK